MAAAAAAAAAAAGVAKKLLTPSQLGKFTAANRVVLAPLTRGRSTLPGNIPNEAMEKYYVQRSSAGLMVTEATAISTQGSGWYGAPGIYTEEQVAGWGKVTAAVKAKNPKALFFLQAWHMGRVSHSSFQDGGAAPVGPSAIAVQDTTHTADGSKQPYEVPRELTLEEIPGVVQQYKQGALNALKAGFDGVEIHGANGYLIDQFLQSSSNQRTDKYGGSIENRIRFLQEVVTAVISVLPADRVGIRIAPNGSYGGMGSPDYHELFQAVLKFLEPLGLAYVHIMDGLAFGFHKLGPEPFTLDEARSVYKGTIIGNCGYTQETAEAAVASGKADLIAFGRPYLSNPDLVERFAHGWELAPPPGYDAWYGTPTTADPNKGYTDFPAHA